MIFPGSRRNSIKDTPWRNLKADITVRNEQVTETGQQFVFLHLEIIFKKEKKIEDKKEESIVLYRMMLAVRFGLPPTVPKLRKHRKLNDRCIV